MNDINVFQLSLHFAIQTVLDKFKKKSIIPETMFVMLGFGLHHWIVLTTIHTRLALWTGKNNVYQYSYNKRQIVYINVTHIIWSAASTIK